MNEWSDLAEISE